MSEQGTTGQQTGMDRFFAALRGIGLRRRTDDKWIAGVSSGLADRLGIDPVIVRAGFVLLFLLGGIGITIYLVAWALVPNDRDEIMAQRALRDGEGGPIVLLIFAAMSLFGGTAIGGSWWGGHSGAGWGFPWGVFLTGLLIWWLVKRSGNRHDADERVRAGQVSPSPVAGPRPAASGPVVAQTQVLPQSQQGRMQWEGSPGFPQGPGSSQGPSRPQATVVPRKLRRRSGGPLLGLLAIGLALATYGSLIWAANAFSWTGSHTAIALAGSLAAVGLLSVVLGIAGWRAGFIAFIAVALAFAAWTSSVVPAGVHLSGRVGDATWKPASVTSSTASNPYHLGIGNGVLDLSGLPSEGLATLTGPATIPVSVGLGDLTVLVPQGLTVKVVGHVSLGAIQFPADLVSHRNGGSDVSRSTVVGEGPTQVVVNAGVGIGQLTVVKE